ncbi:DUF805 domain-containing protein [Caulobacter sp. LARHSG274]
MTFVQKLFSFQGRLRRRDYWLYSILLVAGALAVLVPVILALGLQAEDARLSLLGLVLTWPSMALLVKRIHDRDKTGRMALIYWIPSLVSTGLGFIPAFGLGGLKVFLDISTGMIGLWFLVEFGFMDGTQGPNEYGPSPKGVVPKEKLADVFS